MSFVISFRFLCFFLCHLFIKMFFLKTIVILFNHLMVVVNLYPCLGMGCTMDLRG